jgi:hypothetical protein
MVDVSVDGEVHSAIVGLPRDPFEAGEHILLEEMLGQPHQTLRRQPDVADVVDVEQAADE